MNRRLASLSRFLPKLTKKAKPFYKLLKKIESFLLNKGREKAFLAFKKTIAISGFPITYLMGLFVLTTSW